MYDDNEPQNCLDFFGGDSFNEAEHEDDEHVPDTDETDFVKPECWDVKRTFTDSLKVEKAENPHLEEYLDNISSAFDARLHYQLSELLFEYIQILMAKYNEDIIFPSSRDTGSLAEPLRVFYFLILPLQNQISRNKIIEGLANIVDHLDPHDALFLLSPFETNFLSSQSSLTSFDSKNDKSILNEHWFKWKVLKAMTYLRMGKPRVTVNILETIKGESDELMGASLSMHTLYHKACIRLAHNQKKSDLYYKHCLLYITYCNLDTLEDSEKIMYAFNLIIAALTASNVYSFGELIGHAIMEPLKHDNSKSFLLDLLIAFQDGNQEMFEEKWNTNYDKIREIEMLLKHKEFLVHKIKHLALMDLCFHNPKSTIKFRAIADKCRVDIKQVEVLVIKAISKNLLKGKLNDIKGELSVSWIKPRILDNERLSTMKNKMENWIFVAENLLTTLNESTGIPKIIK